MKRKAVPVKLKFENLKVNIMHNDFRNIFGVKRRKIPKTNLTHESETNPDNSMTKPINISTLKHI